MAASAALSPAGLARAADHAFDPTHIGVTAEVSHVGTSISQRCFDRKDGTVSFDCAAKTGKWDTSVNPSPVSTCTAAFDTRLHSADCFDAVQHAQSMLLFDMFVFTGEQVAEVQGQDTLLDKSQPLAPRADRCNGCVHLRLKRGVCGADFEGTLDRTAGCAGWCAGHLQRQAPAGAGRR